MARLKVSKLTDLLTVHAGDAHVAIAPGQVVDVDARLGDGTLGDALGVHLESFGEVEPSVEAASEAAVEPTKASSSRKRD